MTPADDAAIADAANVLREKVDVLLDRLTDVVLGSPAPGTVQWRKVIQSSGDLTRVMRDGCRAGIRARIATHAGIIDPADASQHPSATAQPKRPRRRLGADSAQLFIF